MINHNKPTISFLEMINSLNSIRSGQLSTDIKVKELESKIGNFFQLEPKNIALVSSGSAALYIVSSLAGFKNKRVGVPIYTCNAVSNSVKMSGAKVKFIDSEPNSPNADYSELKSDKFDALIAVSTFGKAAALPQAQTLKVVEDISQAFGTKIGCKPVGLRGLAGIASLSATKIITTAGQGGLIISSHENFMEEVKDFLKFDNRNDANFRFNFTITEQQAAFGLAQIKKIPVFLQRREEIYQKYMENFAANMYNFHSKEDVKYRFILKEDNPEKIINYLGRNGINAIVPYRVNEFMDLPIRYKNARKFASSSVSIPIYPKLTNKEVNKIISTVLKFKL